MATVVSITNPITGAVEQVDKLDATAQQIDDAVALAPQLSNPNLLDNWYFANPVNQRGQTSYTGAGYGIDRWFISSNISMVINNDGTVTFTNNGTQNGIKVYQTIEAFLQNIPHTMSILATEVTGTVLMYLQESGGSYDTPISGKKIVAGLTKDTGTPTPSKSYRYQYIFTLDAGASVTLKAAKLELGTTQTLAHQDADGNWVLNEIPDYGEQLARCQRYCLAISRESRFVLSQIASNNSAHFAIPTPVTMRTTPAIINSSNIILFNSNTEVIGGVELRVLAISPNQVQLVFYKESIGLTAGFAFVGDGGAILSSDL